MRKTFRPGNQLLRQSNIVESEAHQHCGGVSTAYYVDFPNDPEMVCVLPVHYPLTHDQMASYGFDPSAELPYALELLPQLDE